MLPLTGPISSSQIASAVGASSPYSLHSMSGTAGFSTPDSMDEFHGYPFVSGAILFLDANNASSYGGSGTTWYDLSGNGYNASFTSAGGGSNPVFTTAGSLNYFQFTGVSPSGPHYTGGSYMTLSNNIDTNYVTIQCWFNNNTYAPYVMILGGKTANSSVYQGYELYINGSAIGNADGRITTGGSTSNTDISYAYAYNTWYNFALTYDGSNMYTYLNGTQVASSAKTGTTNTGRPFLIGAQYLDGSTPSEFLNGAIGSMFVYNRALTGAEILRNYNAQVSLYGSGGGSGEFTVSDGFESSCSSDGYPNTIFGNDVGYTSSTRFFTDAGLSTPFNGGSLWYMEYASANSVQIDSDGYNIDYVSC